MAPTCLNASPTGAKWIYLTGFLLQTVCMWLLRDYGPRVLRYVGPLSACAKAGVSAAAADACMGKGAVLRLAWGGVLFFGVHALLLLCVSSSDDARLVLHTGCPPGQLLLWAALCGSAFAMPNSFFAGFGQAGGKGGRERFAGLVWGVRRAATTRAVAPQPPRLWRQGCCDSHLRPTYPSTKSHPHQLAPAYLSQFARGLAGVFWVVQIVILLDFVFGVNEWLLDREWGAALIAGSALLYGGGLAALGVLYHFWAPHARCSLNIFIITWTLILGLFYSGLSVAPWRPQYAGLLTSAAVFAYTAYMAWAALSSEPDGAACAPGGTSGGLGLKVAAFAMTMLALLYTTLSSSTEARTFSTAAGDGEAPAGGDADAELPYRPDFFHFVFCAASAYAAMVFVSWDLASVTPGQQLVVDRGWASFWVKVCAQWLCALLYAWILAAPAVLTDREFG